MQKYNILHTTLSRLYNIQKTTYKYMHYKKHAIHQKAQILKCILQNTKSNINKMSDILQTNTTINAHTTKYQNTN